MKYYERSRAGGFLLVVDQQRIKAHVKGDNLIAVPDLSELKKIATKVISEIKTSRLDAKDNLIKAIEHADSIQQIHDEMINTYKSILPQDKNPVYSLYAGNGILAKAIRYIFSKYLHMQLGNKLNQDGEVPVTAKIPGIRTLMLSHLNEENNNNNQLYKSDKSK